MFTLKFILYGVFLLIFGVFSRVLPEKTSIFRTSKLPSDSRLYATVSNGYVGMAVLSDTMYIGGVFNGPIALNSSNYNNQISHRARIPSTNSISLKFNSANSRYNNLYTLDVNNAIYIEMYQASNFIVNSTVYAHRYHRNLLITEISIDNTQNNNDLIISLDNNAGKPSTDINMTAIECPSNTIFKNISCQSGWTQISEYNASLINIVTINFNLNNMTISSKSNAMILYYPTVLLTTLETSSDTILNDAVKLFTDLFSSRDEWLNLHISEWENIWMNGRIDIIGNDTVSASIYSSLYYIISSLRNDWNYGLSPGSLSSNAYSGHSFWDMDTWMYPPLLLLQSNLSETCLEYRNNRKFGASFTANTSSRSGLQGSSRYPWESAFTGIELQGSQWGTYEIHINADIVLAIKQYFYTTKNITFLNEIYDMIYGICLFWSDWSYYNVDTKLYEFLNVMGPDEYYYPVNNSCYTNFGAQQTLSFCIQSSKLLNKQYPSIWEDIVNNTYIPFDEKLKYHPENDEFNDTKTVKQADVIMLYFPWMLNVYNNNNNDTQQIQINDLNIYSLKTSPSGPAMTWAMFVINWLELNQSKTAQSYFDKSYSNIQQPFNIWTETATGGGAVNFITGAGGFLQQFIYGYPQIRIHKDYLFINFNYLPWNQMNLIGIDYLQNSLDFTFFANNVSFNVVVTNKYGSNQIVLQLIDSNHKTQTLEINKPLTITANMNPVKIQQSA